jgi:hypothetical protein
MADIITCPACERKLQVPESFYGQTVQCPDCAHQFMAEPHAESVQANAPPPPVSTPAPNYDERTRRRRRDYDDHQELDDDDYSYSGMYSLRRRRGTPHRGGVILALGIISLVIFPYSTIVCGPLAWILGTADLAEIRAGRMDETGEGLVQAGRVLGIISTCILLVSVVTVCGCFGVGMLTARH